jgi:NAD(P)-dependent dehydrogenase (short-subunit alcohol dehydrogenase family)
MLAANCAALAAALRGTGVTANAVSPGSSPILDESARLCGLESAEGIVWLVGVTPDALTGAVPVDGRLSL